MQNPQTTTKMTSPKDGKELVAKATEVKLRCLREFEHRGQMTKIGQEIMATEAEAEHLCAASKGGYAFAGERMNSDQIPRFDYTKAERVRSS